MIEQVRSYRFSIKQIFKEHWENYLSQHKDSLRQDVIWTVEKMLSCRDPKRLGYHKYACPEHPDEYVIVPHSCKTRFCNSCGKVLTDKWVKRIENDFPPTGFHHICFTVPKELRELLDEYRFLLNSLFRASSQTVLSWSKERGFLPAIVSSSHTFGRALNFHPHIHMLISAGGIDLKNKRLNRWRSSSFIPFKMLHKRYRFLLIHDLKKTIKKYLKENSNSGKLSVFSYPGILDSFFDPLFKINWYVHDSTQLPHEEFTVSYIVRYAKRPPLAEWRILDYDKNPNSGKCMVTFSYKKREEPEVKWTLPVEKFINLLIQHIPSKHFRCVRYYGALATRTKPLLKKALGKLFRRMNEMSKFTRWRERLSSFTGKDPLRCPICQRKMELVEVAYFSKKLGSLNFYHPP
ncbi:MAG: transposase [Candidatus Aerophobetes bacterium]|nr:transposase [Candidatus Aerophobetes bacterium]